MVNMNRELTLASTCEQTVVMLTAVMALHGYRLERSFDLRSALHDQPDCPCPHHGTAQCSCQYVVLLAYEQTTTAPPAVITAHECDGLTRVRVTPDQLGGKLSWPLLAVLDEAMKNVVANV